MKNELTKEDIAMITKMMRKGVRSGFSNDTVWSLEMDGIRDIEDIIESIIFFGITGYNWRFRVKKYDKK